ncbi:oxidoreductase [Lasius niger]|uniref:Oxidoreductase n=1 Tax=Lasius niger TaxID=67767 RepID=A0A0J7K584_LASNI|nr:oxidoreductase [Lasius niger]
MDLNLGDKAILLLDFTGKTSPSLLEEISKQIFIEGGNLTIASAKENLAQEISTKLQGNIRPLPVNPATEEGRKEILKNIPACDIFIDASLPKVGSKMDQATWDEDFSAATRASQLLSFPYLRLMKEKNWGRIITLALHSNAMRDESESSIRAIQKARAAFSASLSNTVKGTLVSANLCQLHLTGYPAPDSEKHIAKTLSFLSSPASDGLNGGIISVEC